MKITPADSTLDISRNQNRNDPMKNFHSSPYSNVSKFRSPDSTGNPEDDYSNYQSYIAEELNEVYAGALPKVTTNLIRISRPFRLRWDFFMIIVALYNTITTPFVIAFFNAIDPWFLELNIGLNFIYYIDIGFNFFTTYIDSKDDEVFDHRKIILHYLSKMFIFDLFSALPIGEIMILKDSGIGERKKLWLALNMLKVNIILTRLGRMLRFARTKDYVKVLMRLAQLTLYLMMWVHLTACIWFYVIRDDEEWVPTSDFLSGETQLYTEDTVKKYVVLFYHAVWLLVGNDVVPRDAEQACLGSFLIIIGSIITAVLFGEMVVLMSNLSRKQDQFQELLDGAMTTMSSMKLPDRLKAKILDYIAATHMSSSSQEEYETFKKFISPSLQQEVSACIYDPIISKNHVLQNEERMFYMLVHKLSNRFTKPEDEIITEGAEPDNMYFLVNGEVQVFVTDKNLKKNSVCFLSPGAQFGELGLIYNIHRTASVSGYGYCTIAELSKKNFQSLVLSFPTLESKLIRASEVYDDPWKRFLLDSLSQAEYFEALPKHVFSELAYRMEIMKLEKGAYLFKPGDIPKCIYIVAFGDLEISATINEKHLHLLKVHERFPEIESEPRIPKKHTTLEDYKPYFFDIFKAECLKKKAEIVPITSQKGIVGSIRLDEELPEQTSLIGDYPQEIIIGNISQGALISSRFIHASIPYLFQCKALNAVTVYALKIDTIKELSHSHSDFKGEIKVIKEEIKGKKYPDILDVIEPETSSSLKIRKLWVSAILRVISTLRQERRGGVALLLQITSKLKAIIACEEANNFDLAEKVARGDIPPHYILEDGTLDPAAINSSINSTLPRSHPIMMAFKEILDSITQPGGNIVKQYNSLEKRILQQSKLIQSYEKNLNDLKLSLRKIIDNLKGNPLESYPSQPSRPRESSQPREHMDSREPREPSPLPENIDKPRNKEMLKLDIQKVYMAQEARQKRRDERKQKKMQMKNDRASVNEAVIRPRNEENESKDLLSFIKDSKEQSQ